MIYYFLKSSGMESLSEEYFVTVWSVVVNFCQRITQSRSVDPVTENTSLDPGHANAE